MSIALALIELTIRLVSPQVDVEMWFLSNTRYGHTLKKNFHQAYRYPQAGITIDVSTNSLGFRAREVDLSRPHVSRVLLLGDSFTFGEGLNVDEIFATKLESLLNQTSREYVVVNAGVGGWGTLQETVYAKDHFNLLRPDFIVLTFCGNDPSDDVAFSRGAIDNEYGRFYFPGKIWLRNNSHLYRFLYTRAFTLRHIWTVKAKMRAHPEIPMDGQSSSLITPEEWASTLRYVTAFFNDFITFNPRGVLLLQTTYPTNDNIRNNLKSLDNGENLIYVDLRDATVRLGPGRMRLPYDGHWTPEMHSLSARALFERISRIDHERVTDVTLQRTRKAQPDRP